MCIQIVVNPEEGGSIFLKNADVHLQHYTLSQPKRLQTESYLC
jgi:hypothetical protein